MKIRTTEQLSDALSAEIIWRKKELSTVRSLVDSARPHADRRNALTRCGIAVLYAHWEGFVRAAAAMYLEFIAMQRRPYQDFTANFVALAMKGKLEMAKVSSKASVFNEVAEFFLTGLSETARIPVVGAINTKSNLSSMLFREIIFTLNLDYAPFASKEKLVDETLLKTRNSVAHGEFLEVDIDRYLELQLQIIDMMELLRNQIENAASTRAYLRTKADQPSYVAGR